MNVEIKYRPAFATLFITLEGKDSIVAESDAMASMSANVGMRTKLNGGFLRAILRKFFGGESLFVNEFFSEDGQPAQLVLTQPSPGDMEALQLSGNAFYMQPGAFIACTPGVNLGLGWAGWLSWLQGEGLFRLEVSGEGTVWFGGYGGLFERPVNGEYVVDSGHLIAYEPTVELKFGLAGGLMATLFGGEGVVTRMKGQGKIYMQSRSMEGLAAWTNHHIW